MEYLKGSYSISNTQATWPVPPGSPATLTVIVTGIVTGKPTLIHSSPWFPRDVAPPGSPEQIPPGSPTKT